MSISTTSGRCGGIIFNASSAVEQAHTHSKPSAKLTIVSSPSRVVLLSSTIATLVIRNSLQREVQLHFGSDAGAALYAAISAQRAHSGMHPGQTVFSWNFAVHRESAPVIRERDFEFRIGMNVQSHFSRAGMTDNVIERFLKGEKNPVPQLGIHGDGREFFGNLQAASDARQF